MIRPRKILVPTDFSDYSRKALQRAMGIAQDAGSEVVLLHIVDRDVSSCTMEYCLDESEMDRQRQAILRGAHERLIREIEENRQVRDVKIRAEVREGVPYDEILKYEDLHDIDLIVIASHGRSAILKYFLGSVTSHVVKGAKNEVLLVR